jgi:hypothetical protein
VLEKLQLTSEAFLVLGIVSGNDYSPNARGFGIRKNTLILRQLVSQLNENMSSDELLTRYCEYVEVEKR